MELVGTGTQLVFDGATLLVVGLALVVLFAGQVYTVVDKVGDGAEGPLGGYLEVQPPLLQFPPGHELPQYVETEEHQLEKWKQFRLSGHPACMKQEAT